MKKLTDPPALPIVSISMDDLSKRPSRLREREARRAEAKLVAREASERRSLRRKSVVERVDAAMRRLSGMKPADIQALMDTVPSAERDFYIIAEELGANRKTVLQQMGVARGSVRQAYLQAAGISAEPSDEPIS